MKIGFIGQGWIGRNYANDFEKRGYEVIRYGLEEPHSKNKELIKDCDIVFIAVPTPTTPEGFNFDAIRDAMKVVGQGRTVVIKSTILPGTTRILQKENPGIYVMHSPEFLVEATAEYDAAHPNRNIVGIPEMTDEYKERAEVVMSVLPFAPFHQICHSREAELVKYAGNCFFYFKVVYMNMIYDLAQKLNCDWEVIREAMGADPRIGKSHMNPVHQSGRGAGGHCFIKDFAALAEIYEEKVGDKEGLELLESMKNKNIKLLLDSKKDLDLLAGVYKNNN